MKTHAFGCAFFCYAGWKDLQLVLRLQIGYNSSCPWEMLFGRKVGDLGGSLGILAVPPGEMMLLR